MKLKILTEKGEEKILNITPAEFEEIIAEFAGELPYIKEFETTSGEIITSDEILSMAE